MTDTSGDGAQIVPVCTVTIGGPPHGPKIRRTRHGRPGAWLCRACEAEKRKKRRKKEQGAGVADALFDGFGNPRPRSSSHAHLYENPSRDSGRLRAAIPDATAEDPSIPAAVKLIGGAHVFHRQYPPGVGEIQRALPCISDEDHAAAMRYIAQHLAYVNRSGNKHGRPIKLQRLSDKLNTWTAGSRYTIVPLAPLSRLGTGRGVEEAGMLWVIYVRQQLITGAIQLSDTAAAAMLGWRTQKVKRWRPALLQAGLIREVQPIRGTQAAIYVADEADSPPNLDSFDPAKTRTLERFDVNGQTVTVYARCGELAAIEARLEVADDDDQRALLQLAQTTRLLRARDVLDGPLEGAGRDPDYHAFLTTGCDGATDQRWPGTVSGDVPT